MKRKAEPKTCPQCQRNFGHGFALINHMRYCLSESSAVAPLGLAANQSSSKDKDDDDVHFPSQHEDEHHQSSTQDDDVHFPSWTREQGLQHTQQPIMTRKVVRKLTPQLKGIVEFLETVEFGEGSSRAHSQHSLDYTRSCVCAKTQLLPKDIKTCWRHVAKFVLSH